LERVLYNIEKIINPSPEELDALRRTLHPRVLAKHEHFLREGEVCRTMALLEKGSVRLYYAVDGREICKDFLFQNAVVGSFASFFTQQPSALNVAAMEETSLLEIAYADVMYLYDHYPAWQKLARLIAQEQFVRDERREASLLKDPPEVRYRNLVEEHPKVFKKVPLQYIASYLGITPETLSRYRNKVKP
jgi:CRP-like cAMP-binding protein